MLNAETLLMLAALLILLALAVGLARSILGPTLQDRMLSVQLLGTGGVALSLVMSALFATPALIDVALVLSLLAVVAAAALTRRETDND